MRSAPGRPAHLGSATNWAQGPIPLHQQPVRSPQAPSGPGSPQSNGGQRMLGGSHTLPPPSLAISARAPGSRASIPPYSGLGRPDPNSPGARPEGGAGSPLHAYATGKGVVGSHRNRLGATPLAAGNQVGLGRDGGETSRQRSLSVRMQPTRVHGGPAANPGTAASALVSQRKLQEMQEDLNRIRANDAERKGSADVPPVARRSPWQVAPGQEARSPTKLVSEALGVQLQVPTNEAGESTAVLEQRVLSAALEVTKATSTAEMTALSQIFLAESFGQASDPSMTAEDSQAKPTHYNVGLANISDAPFRLAETPPKPGNFITSPPKGAITQAQALSLRCQALKAWASQGGDSDSVPIGDLPSLAAGHVAPTSTPEPTPAQSPPVQTRPMVGVLAESGPLPATDADAEVHLDAQTHADSSSYAPFAEVSAPSCANLQPSQPSVSQLLQGMASLVPAAGDLGSQLKGLKKKPSRAAGSNHLASLSEVSTNAGGSPVALAAAPASAASSSCGADSTVTAELLRKVPANATRPEVFQMSARAPDVVVCGEAEATAAAICNDGYFAAASAEVAADRHPTSTPDPSVQALQKQLGEALGALGREKTEREQKEALKKQLAEAMGALSQEKVEREKLSSHVRTLTRRLDEGLASVGEVTAARSETEGATDAVLGAMRRCIDELSAHCAWPPPGAEKDAAQAATLSEAVRQQQAQLQQLQQLHSKLQAQHEEQRQQSSTLSTGMQQQQHRLDEGMAAILAATAAFPARLDTTACSVNALQHRVAELFAASEQSNADGEVTAQLSELQLQQAAALVALQEKVDEQARALKAEKSQLTEAIEAFKDPRKELADTIRTFQAMSDEQTAQIEELRAAQLAQAQFEEQKLETQELRAAQFAQERQIAALAAAARAAASKADAATSAAESAVANAAASAAASKADKDDAAASAAASASLAASSPDRDLAAETSADVQGLKEEVTTIATALTILCNRVNTFTAQDTASSMQTEIGAIANVVSNLSNRVDTLAGQDAMMNLSMEVTPSGEETVETAQALRHRLAALVGDVRRVHDERREAESMKAFTFPSDHLSQPGSVSLQQVSYASSPGRSRSKEQQEASFEGTKNFLEWSEDASTSATVLEYQRLGAEAQPPRMLTSCNDAAGALEDLSDARMVPRLQLMSQTQMVPESLRKAPSPRRWLSEPLSVSVGRHDAHLQSTHASMAAVAGERMLLRGSGTRL